MVMSGNSALGEVPLQVQPSSVTGTLLRLPATVGLRGGDLVLVLENLNNCMLQQVNAGFLGGASQVLNFGGAYAANTINSVNLDGFGVSSDAFVAPLGNVAGNQPSFVLIGLDANTRLVTFDMLSLDGATSPTAITDGVVDLRARYGVDTDDNGTVDTWVNPAVARWSAATLLDGSAASNVELGRILAVRVGLVLRNNVPERDPVSPTSLVLFPDLDAALRVTRNLSDDERRLRHRTLEFTVPLRNVMLKP
jgi:type IV pilus assembly protein PilW